MVDAHGVETTLALGHATYTLWIFAVPMLVSMLIEAPLALLSDRLDRRWMLVSGLLALSGSLVCAALAQRAWVLSLGLALAGSASGVACAIAQSELVQRSEGAPERALSRWTVLGWAGDLLTPALIMLSAQLGSGYRCALLVVAALLLLQAGLLSSAEHRVPPRGTDGEEQEDEPPPLLVAMREAARDARLWWLLLGSALCSLLDELVAALIALRLHTEHGLSEGMAAGCLSAFAVGGLIGALASDVLLQHMAARMLWLLSSGGSLAALALVLWADGLAASLAALVGLGITVAPHYPLTKAAAYARVPNRPGMVNALVQPFSILEVLLPLVAGVIATHFGLTVAIAALAIQPLAMCVLAATAARGLAGKTDFR